MEWPEILFRRELTLIKHVGRQELQKAEKTLTELLDSVFISEPSQGTALNCSQALLNEIGVYAK